MHTDVRDRPEAHAPAKQDVRLSVARELATTGMVWRRELIRYRRARTRVITGLMQPILYLFVLGYGLTPLVGETAGFDFKKFVFPGVVAMSVVTTSIFSAISIVWDREFGFLREMLVAPVSRVALVVGKALGGATVSTIQGAIMLALAPLVGVRLTPTVVIAVFAISMLMAFSMTCFGVFFASRLKKIENFQVVMQFLLLPMLFLSGALFPPTGLPSWLMFLTRINPLTYAVDPLKRVVYAAQDIPDAALERFDPPLEVFGYAVPSWLSLSIVMMFGVAFLALSIRSFGKDE